MTTRYPDRMNLWVTRDTVRKLKLVCEDMEKAAEKSMGVTVKISQGTAVDALINEYLKGIKK